jgi:hypothetical protein
MWRLVLCATLCVALDFEFENVTSAQGALSSGSAGGYDAELVRQTWDTGLRIAHELLVHSCPGAGGLRVAPLQFEDMGDSGPLMRVNTPVVLAQGLGLEDRLGPTWFPTALLRSHLERNLSRVVWTRPMTPEEERARIAAIFESVQFDVYIRINTRVNFALSDSDCLLVSESEGYHSVVSSLLHELVHTLGFYSYVRPDDGGGLYGYVSYLDGVLQNASGACELADAGCHLLSRQNVQTTKGQDFVGRELWLGGARVYNPDEPFKTNSFWSHLHRPDAVMHPFISSGECKFELTSDDVDALNALGWEQCRRPAAGYAWDTEEARISKLLMMQLLVQRHGEQAVHNLTEYHNTVAVICSDPHYQHHHVCRDESSDYYLLAWLFVSVLMLICCAYFVVWPILREQEMQQVTANLAQAQPVFVIDHNEL